MEERAVRLAENEAVFRAGNEAINSNRGVDDEQQYLCECGADTCFERVVLTRAEYEEVRSHPARFVVVPGHQDETAGEVVVEPRSRYTIVEKQADGRAVAERTNPRREP
jgi:hypothetical protein